MASLQVQNAIASLGRDIRLARQRRRMSIKDFADRVSTSEATIMRLEKGDPGIRIEVIVAALSVLGKLKEFAEILEPGSDDQGLMIDREHLPSRFVKRSSHLKIVADAKRRVEYHKANKPPEDATTEGNQKSIITKSTKPKKSGIEVTFKRRKGSLVGKKSRNDDGGVGF